MTVTTAGLTKAAGISAAVAGLLFIAVQINHPPMVVESVTSTEWVIRNSAKVVLTVAGLAGITGMYLPHVRRTGILGLIGYLLFSAGLLVMMAIAFVGAYVLPSLADVAPGYVNDVLATAAGGTATGDIGLMRPAILVEAALYLSGGFIFGLALFRARVVARWAAALLSLGALATLAIPVLPQSFERPFAFPTGIALIGLGISMWRGPRATAPAPAAVEPATVR
jgi:hypothetical protein